MLQPKTAVDSSVTKNVSQNQIFELQSEISELRDENYKLKKKVKDLEAQLDQKSRLDLSLDDAHGLKLSFSKVWFCQICMEDDNIRVVLGCGHSVCEECQGK